MGIVFIALSYFIGAVWFPPSGGGVGIVLAVFLWVIWSLISYFSGDSIILMSSRAMRVTRDIHPQLFNVTEEMKIAAGLSAMPKIYIMDEPSPNAFAAGRDPKHSAIVVTAGLLSRLNRDELQGVIAHEMSHILNRDVLYLTFCGVMLGSIVIISEIFLRTLFFTGSSRRYRTSSGGGQTQLIMMLIAVVLAILAPLLAYIFYFSISRKREYLADASGVRLTRYPEGLASALEKISQVKLPLHSANKITAPMFIINPLKKVKNGKMVKAHLFDTHPPIDKRIQILRGMMGGVNYTNYIASLNKVTGSKGMIMPSSSLADTENISFRKSAGEETGAQTPKDQARQLGDLMRAVNNYAFLVCICGLKIKIPPNFKKDKISCPRGGRQLDVPLNGINTAAAALGSAIGLSQQAEPFKAPGTGDEKTEHSVYVRKTNGWESAACPCGNLLRTSPLFTGQYIVCSHCGRRIEIKKQ